MKRQERAANAGQFAQGDLKQVKALASPFRFVALFVLFLIAGFGLLVSHFVRPALLLFSRSLVELSATLIQLCGGNAKATGVVMLNPASGFGVEMQDGCNGINVTILLSAAVLAFPASWKWKLKGLLAGVSVIQIVNLIRFVSLFYLGQYSMFLFTFAHNYLWEAMLMLDAMVIFWLWAQAVFHFPKSEHFRHA